MCIKNLKESFVVLFFRINFDKRSLKDNLKLTTELTTKFCFPILTNIQNKCKKYHDPWNCNDSVLCNFPNAKVQWHQMPYLKDKILDFLFLLLTVQCAMVVAPLLETFSIFDYLFRREREGWSCAFTKYFSIWKCAHISYGAKLYQKIYLITKSWAPTDLYK